MGLSYSEFVTSCLSVCTSLFPQVLQNPNYFPVTFSLADAVHRHYSVIKIILYHLLDIHTKKADLIGFETRNTFFLSSFQSTFSNSWMCNLAKLILKISRYFGWFLNFYQFRCDSFYEFRRK